MNPEVMKMLMLMLRELADEKCEINELDDYNSALEGLEYYRDWAQKILVGIEGEK